MNWKTILASAITLGITLNIAAGSAYAAPSVKQSGNNFIITEALTDEGMAQINAAMSKVDQKKLRFELVKITDADLSKVCKAFPNIVILSVRDSDALSSIEPMAALKALREIDSNAKNIKDFSALSGLTEMTHLTLSSKMMGPDLKWMSGMTKLVKVSISAGKDLTSFEGLPSLPALKLIRLSGAAPADLTPLLAMPGLTNLELSGCVIGDLTPLTKLPNLSILSLYGATVHDFSPLAACPNLKKLTYYAVKDADFSTLGKLTQLQELNGGLTKLDNISWIANLKNLKKADVFSEYVRDYSPLAQTNVERFQIWSMRVPVDLKSLAGAVTLKELKLWSLKNVSGFEGLAPLANMEKLVLDSVNEKDGVVDLSFIKGMPKITTLELSAINGENTAALEALSALNTLNCKKINKIGDKPFDFSFAAKLGALQKLSINDGKVSHFEAIANCPKLHSISILKTEGITSLEPLKKLPSLRNLTVSKGAFPDAELTGFDSKVKIIQR